MSTTVINNRKESTLDQFSGVVVDNINRERIADEIAKLKIQFERKINATSELNRAREFIKDDSTILGRANTKHGEIAEQLEVASRRANDVIDGKTPTASFENVGRFAPEDYTIEGVKVQSKYYNGPNNTLKGVQEHLRKYENFSNDGSYYHIPKNHYEIIKKVMNNENVENLNSKSILAIKANVRSIEEKTGKSFEDILKPSEYNYDQVQQGKISETIDSKQKEINKKNRNKEKEIRLNHEPSLREGLKASAQAASITGVLSGVSSLYSKYKDGKLFYKDFTAQDWKDVGIDSAKGAIGGGISGAAVYYLTNNVSLTAPFAAAIVSATRGVYELQKQYNAGEINKQDYFDLGIVTCSQTALIAISTGLGQALIPVPVLGAMIGSIAGSMLANLTGNFGKPVSQIHKEFDEVLLLIDKTKADLLDEIRITYSKLETLTEVAFNAKTNEELCQLSIKLARQYGVRENEIIHNKTELDNYILR